MGMPLDPRASGEFIASCAKDVSINNQKMCELATMLADVLGKDEYGMRSWKGHPLHPDRTDFATVDWIFVADTLNFSFWGENDNKFGVKYNGKLYTGYWSLHAAIRRALQEEVNIIDPKFYAKMDKSEFVHFLRSDTSWPIPLLDERYKVLKEAGNILNEKYESTFVTCITESKSNAVKLMELIVKNFPSYRDEAEYEGKKVCFYKRAQILVSDVWACFEGNAIGAFTDIDCLTMFADYRIPQVLAYLGVLKYSDALTTKLQDEYLFCNGDREEVELRGCSIAAVELLKEEIKEKLSSNNATKNIKVNSALIDFFLWDYQQKHRRDVQKVPFHKVRCIYY
uniref:Queuosine 5'-phosphate N-glycosylase/hydrolase n=1 Tax=Strigamia maritima TaxID=126957 RepID=T1JJ82_STRMM